MSEATSGGPRALEFIEYRKDAHVAYVTLNRPDVRNALHTGCYEELRECWLDIGRDPEIYVGIVTGNGDAFCAGRDVKYLADHQRRGIRTPHEDPNSDRYRPTGVGALPWELELDKPLIAAVNGFAVGIGLSLVLQCQLRVMADDAWLGDQHTNIGRLGSPETKYTAMPRASAAYLTLCNGRLGASECLRQGIVNRVVPRDRVVAAAEELAEMVCKSAPRAVQAAVRLYRLSAATPVLSDLSRHFNRGIAAGDDAIEGPRAFKERRPAVWSGR